MEANCRTAVSPAGAGLSVHTRHRRVATLLAMLALGSAACSRSDRTAREAAEHVKRHVQASPRSPQHADVRDDVRRFYERNTYRPAWFRGARPGVQWDRLMQALDGASKHGLDPRAYGVEALRAQRTQSKKGLFGRESFEPAQIGSIDVQLTRAFLKYAWHLRYGEVDPRDLDARWRPRRPKVDRVAALDEALQTGDVEGALDRVAPRHVGYTRLVSALESYRALGTHPAETRLRQIELNLDRWRWLPEDLGTRHLVVNIPGYDLRLVQDGREALRMRVIVGTREDPTPVFSDPMTHVVFSPTWNVPETIVAEEIVPAVKEDDTFLERNSLEFVVDGQVVDVADVDLDDLESFRVRQPPGPNNALGHVKFLLPNHFSVYLHDTPADHLFARDHRAFSHGCVRVEKPVELARHLLADQAKWSVSAIEAAMASGEERAAKLTAPLPVHIVYWTAWVEDDGTIQFGDDVYGYDRAQAAVLMRGRPWLERQAAR